MKKVLRIIIAGLLVTGVLSGCGGKEDKDSKEASKQDSGSSESSKKENTNSDKNGGIKIDLGKMGENLNIPKSFPEDVVPIIKDANVVNVIDNKDAQAVSVTFTTEKDIQYAIDFYKKVLKNGDDYTETEVQGGTILYSFIDGYAISATMVEYKGDNVSIMINVGYNQKDEVNDDKKDDKVTSDDNEDDEQIENKDDNIETNYYEEAEEVEILDNYPIDKFPILKGDKVTGMSFSEEDEKSFFFLNVSSEKTIKEIEQYYEKSWGKLENMTKQIGNDSFLLMGEIQGGGISVGGDLQDDKAKTVEYVVTIYIVKAE